MKIGIMGGSFDPIHNGHLAAANEVLMKYKLDKIYFVPLKKNPFKSSADSTSEHRIKMLDIATKSNKAFEISDIDIKRPKKTTYTYDTLTYLHKIYPRAKFYFITGLDAIKHISKWYKANDLFKLATFIGVTRPSQTEPVKVDSRVKVLKIPAMEISSTELRRRIKNNKSIRYLTPEKVVNYIKQNNLYK